MIAADKAQQAVEAFAEALAEAVADKLAARGLVFAATPVLRGQYDPAECGALARELGDNPLVASDVMFGLLAKNGEVGAVELAKALGIPRTPTIAMVVTTPLKRIASRLGLPWPFDAVTGSDGRTLWRDRDGIAGRMLDAIRNERQSRGI